MEPLSSPPLSLRLGHSGIPRRGREGRRKGNDRTSLRGGDSGDQVAAKKKNHVTVGIELEDQGWLGVVRESHEAKSQAGPKPLGYISLELVCS